jgi:profilin
MTTQGKEGLIAAKTVQALIIAHHPDTVLTNACSSTVEQLADYLKGVGY